MLLDRKVYSASGADPNHAVQRTGFPQVSVLAKNEGRSLQNMSSSNRQSLKRMSSITSPIGKRKNKRQQKLTTTTTTKRLSSGLVGLISIKIISLTKMASCFFPGD